MGIQPGQTGRCPHCKISVRFEVVQIASGNSNFGQHGEIRLQTQSGHRLDLHLAGCPACGRPIATASATVEPGKQVTSIDALLWPDTAARPVPAEVEAAAPTLAADFREAAAVFAKSKKASAALSRRCLQYVLTHKGGAKSKDLADQIDEVLSKLPSEIADNVDAIRHVGNFAAHPMKSKASREIVEVEEGEAEWLLDVLEELFDFYYVGPAQASARRDALNKKLSSLGKPPLKTPLPTP